MLGTQYEFIAVEKTRWRNAPFFSSLMTHFVKVRLYARSAQSSAHLTLSQTTLSRAPLFKMAFPTYYVAWTDNAHANPFSRLTTRRAELVCRRLCIVVRFRQQERSYKTINSPDSLVADVILNGKERR